MPSARKAVMQMNEKQRKAAIIVASILGCGALFYLGGLLGQVFTNYTIWMESGGMWGQTQIAAPDWNPAVCLLNAFSWNGVKAIFLIVVIGAGIVIYVKVHEKFSQNQYDDRGFTKSKAGTYGTADWMTEKELKAAPQAHLIPSLTMNTGLRHPPAHLQASCCLTMPTTATTQRC